MITHDQITITKYEFDGSLYIKVEPREGRDMSITLPATALMEALLQTGQILEYSFSAEQVRKNFNCSFVPLRRYMENNLDHEMAETLAVHYLSNRTDKASGNYTTTVI